MPRFGPSVPGRRLDQPARHEVHTEPLDLVHVGAEVEVDRIPEVLGESERLQDDPVGAQLALPACPPGPGFHTGGNSPDCGGPKSHTPKASSPPALGLTKARSREFGARRYRPV